MPFRPPPLVLALASSLLATAVVVSFASRRGGRYRALPGWLGSWVLFAVLLVVVSRAPRWASFPLLGAAIFAALRQYFFVAPLRPRDRLAILTAYAGIPLVLWPVYLGSYFGVLSSAVLALAIVFPVLLASGPRQPGLLDSAGRVLLGFLVFVVCFAHLGLLSGSAPGWLELFGVLVVGSELPQRLAGRIRPGEPLLRPLLGVLSSLVLAAALGAGLSPFLPASASVCGLGGIVVAGAATAGGIVSDALAQDLGIGAPPSVASRGAFLDRAMPAVYAAPAFYLYLVSFLGGKGM
jgi:predicted CDP-diglyceride synthetase/phosphatidate cytidylyltransferase